MSSDNGRNPEEEKAIRRGLEKQLGCEFLTEEEMESSIQEAITETPKSNLPIEQPQIEVPIISVGEIITRCNDAMRVMSNGNPHKHLIYLCASALNQLVGRLQKLEQKQETVQ